MSSERTPYQELKRDIKLEEIMHPAVTITPQASVREALKVLLETKDLGVPVVEEEGLLVGFVNDGHLLASALPKYLKVMEDVSFVSEAGDLCKSACSSTTVLSPLRPRLRSAQPRGHPRIPRTRYHSLPLPAPR